MSPLLIHGRTEKDLIRASIQGDRGAQYDIFHLYSGKMMAVCLRYSQCRQEAEDVFQEAFVKVFAHLHEFEYQGSFEGWIRKIVIHTAIRNNRSKYHTSIDVGLDHVAEDTALPEVFSQLSEGELIKMISSLPDGYRMVFNMYAIEGFSHKEIGEMLGIEEATSRSQLAKARKILQEKVLYYYNMAV